MIILESANKKYIFAKFRLIIVMAAQQSSWQAAKVGLVYHESKRRITSRVIQGASKQ